MHTNIYEFKKKVKNDLQFGTDGVMASSPICETLYLLRLILTNGAWH
jgi:hypothetical protein